MTSIDVGKLLERLLRKSAASSSIFASAFVNPDGPEAADTIESLARDNIAMREALVETRKWIAPLSKQGEDRIWRAADHALAMIDAALAQTPSDEVVK